MWMAFILAYDVGLLCHSSVTLGAASSMTRESGKGGVDSSPGELAPRRRELSGHRIDSSLPGTVAAGCTAA